MKTSSQLLNQAVERMSTGYKINQAKDNAANYSIATNMTTKIGALQVAEDNAMQGLDMLMTAADSLAEMENLAIRLRDLAMQTKNGTYSASSIKAINAEASSINNELYRIKETTVYNGIDLLESIINPPTGVGADLDSLKLNSDGFIPDVTQVDTSAMTNLSEATSIVAYGTYSISTPEDLIKLSEISQDSQYNGLILNFVLANDIDMSKYSNGDEFKPIAGSKFSINGNGYKIKNLFINRPNEDNVAFITNAYTTIQNLGFENLKVVGKNSVSGIVGWANNNNIKNCFVKGEITSSGTGAVGGIVRSGANGAKIDSCYVDVIIDAPDASKVGGICGEIQGFVTNCVMEGSVCGKTNVGGVAGVLMNQSLKNCYVKGCVKAVSGSSGGIVGGVQNASLLDSTFYGEIIGNSRGIIACWDSANAVISNCLYDQSKNFVGTIAGAALGTIENVVGISLQKMTNLQVGTSALSSSNISIGLGVSDISQIDSVLNNIGGANSITTIDKVINILSERQTQIGAVQNRLESVLDEISTQYENLASSRSTIRDVDMAKVGSVYIKQQILQDASATLLSSTQNIQYQNVLGLLQSLSG